jgi:hypothetical protein
VVANRGDAIFSVPIKSEKLHAHAPLSWIAVPGAFNVSLRKLGFRKSQRKLFSCRQKKTLRIGFYKSA